MPVSGEALRYFGTASRSSPLRIDSRLTVLAAAGRTPVRRCVCGRRARGLVDSRADRPEEDRSARSSSGFAARGGARSRHGHTTRRGEADGRRRARELAEPRREFVHALVIPSLASFDCLCAGEVILMRISVRSSVSWSREKSHQSGIRPEVSAYPSASCLQRKWHAAVASTGGSGMHT